MSLIALQYDTIEEGVPMPPPGKSSGGPAKRDWAAMKIGACVLKRDFADVVSARDWGKRHGAKFRVRKRREYPYGYRIWRVA